MLHDTTGGGCKGLSDCRGCQHMLLSVLEPAADVPQVARCAKYIVACYVPASQHVLLLPIQLICCSTLQQRVCCVVLAADF
jgi:hypothetical protein